MAAALAAHLWTQYNELHPTSPSTEALPQVQQILAPLRAEAEAYCTEGNKDSHVFYQGRKNSWVVSRKNELLALLGCDLRMVEWRCAGGSLLIPFALAETVNPRSRCSVSDLEAVVDQFSRSQRTRYDNLLHGTGDAAYGSLPAAKLTR